MRLGEFFFKNRGFIPVPFLLVVWYFSRPTTSSFNWGISLMVLGELIRIWGVAYAGGATRTRNVGAPHLVTSGPFAHVRNPLYIGNMLLYTGVAIIANVWQPYLVLVTWLFFGFQYYQIVRLEEEKLRELFGEQYEKYCQQVPRFLPRPTAAPPLTETHPDFKEALRSEKSTFISFAVVLIIFYIKMKFMNR